jgi:tryptophanyl-tRNA synthetase
MSLFESITILKSQLDAAEKEIQALQGGRKASSSRARKSLMSVKSGSHDLRKQIMAHTKGMDVKKRIPKGKQEPVAEPVAEAVVEEPVLKPKKVRKKVKEVAPVE